MFRTILNCTFAFILLFISLLCPILIYNGSQLDVISSLQKTSISYLKLFTFDPQPSFETPKSQKTSLQKHETNENENYLKSTTILDFLSQHCSRINIYLPNQKSIVSAETNHLKDGSFSNHHLRTKKKSVEDLPHDNNETEHGGIDEKNSTDIINKSSDVLHNLSGDKKDDNPNKQGLEDDENELKHVINQLGIAIQNTVSVLSKHATQYPKDVCVVLFFILGFFKMVEWFLIKIKNLIQGLSGTPNNNQVPSSVSRKTGISEDGGKSNANSSLTIVSHTLESVRHLLPVESYPIIPCATLRQIMPGTSSSENTNLREIPDTFTILKNMPADIDVADIYLDTFRRMALQAGKIKTANLLKESQLFLEFRRDSFINNNELQDGGTSQSQTPESSSQMIPVESSAENRSSESQ